MRGAIRSSSTVLWLVAVAAGFVGLARYETTAGAIGTVPAAWPADVVLSRDPARPTLVMFAHPRCPCTRASVGELNRLLARCDGRVAVNVCFFAPSGEAAAWCETGIWRSAARIPGVRVHRDPDGRLADRFGAGTSGHVVLYDAAGRLVFAGGITASRGHEGDNAGRSSIGEFLESGEAPVDGTPVYGCCMTDEPAEEPAGAAED